MKPMKAFSVFAKLVISIILGCCISNASPIRHENIVKLPSGFTVLDDTILSPVEVGLLTGEISGGANRKATPAWRITLKDGFYKIPISKVYPKSYTPQVKDNIDWAIKYIEKGSSVRFIPYTTEPSYVSFLDEKGQCFAHVGIGDGARVISLDPEICFSRGTIVHEFLHILGFSHEHLRHDRDRYIEVFEDETAEIITKYNESEYKFRTKYDLSSIMHYDTFGQSIFGSATLRPRNQKYYPIMVGRRTLLSNCDWFLLNKLYPSPSRPTRSECIPNCLPNVFKPTILCKKHVAAAACPMACLCDNAGRFESGACVIREDLLDSSDDLPKVIPEKCIPFSRVIAKMLTSTRPPECPSQSLKRGRNKKSNSSNSSKEDSKRKSSECETGPNANNDDDSINESSKQRFIKNAVKLCKRSTSNDASKSNDECKISCYRCAKLLQSGSDFKTKLIRCLSTEYPACYISSSRSKMNYRIIIILIVFYGCFSNMHVV